ncbi:hypothetical protein [Streptomyces sp. NPDC015125]|uniref:hypothetical protein n=1 Tax=Streptomyces sp. NPDC015125 TaxID=3364938 RepID=UPI0036FABB1C
MKKKSPHTATITAMHKDGSVCPLTGPHQATGRNSGPACRRHGDRQYWVVCTCGAGIPATDRLDAIVTKATHQARHLRPLTVRYTVDDGDAKGPHTIHCELQPLAA